MLFVAAVIVRFGVRGVCDARSPVINASPDPCPTRKTLIHSDSPTTGLLHLSVLFVTGSSPW